MILQVKIILEWFTIFRIVNFCLNGWKKSMDNREKLSFTSPKVSLHMKRGILCLELLSLYKSKIDILIKTNV